MAANSSGLIFRNKLNIIPIRLLLLRNLFYHPKVPIQAIERTSVISQSLFVIVATRRTIVTHFVDIRPRRNIRFCSHHTPIGILTHSACVWQLHPFYGIGIDSQIPFINSIGVGLGKECKISVIINR